MPFTMEKTSGQKVKPFGSDISGSKYLLMRKALESQTLEQLQSLQKRTQVNDDDPEEEKSTLANERLKDVSRSSAADTAQQKIVNVRARPRLKPQVDKVPLMMLDFRRRKTS